jgi:hypothetical protein
VARPYIGRQEHAPTTKEQIPQVDNRLSEGMVRFGLRRLAKSAYTRPLPVTAHELARDGQLVAAPGRGPMAPATEASNAKGGAR